MRMGFGSSRGDRDASRRPRRRATARARVDGAAGLPGASGPAPAYRNDPGRARSSRPADGSRRGRGHARASVARAPLGQRIRRYGGASVRSRVVRGRRRRDGNHRRLAGRPDREARTSADAAGPADAAAGRRGPGRAASRSSAACRPTRSPSLSLGAPLWRRRLRDSGVGGRVRRAGAGRILEEASRRSLRERRRRGHRLSQRTLRRRRSRLLRDRRRSRWLRVRARRVPRRSARRRRGRHRLRDGLRWESRVPALGHVGGGGGQSS